MSTPLYVLALALFMQCAGLLAKYGCDWQPTAPDFARGVFDACWMLGCLLTVIGAFIGARK